MGRIIANTFVSLDGVMQAPGGPDEDRSGGFRHGGWVMPFFDEEGGAVIGEEIGRLDAMLLGRGTYDIFASYWPHMPADDPVAGPFNGRPKFVVSDTLASPTWRETTVIRRRDTVAEVEKLRRTYGETQVHGSARLLPWLVDHGLVDELRLWVFPVVLGTGKKLWLEGARAARYRLADARSFKTGVVRMRYEPSGVPEYGSATLET